MLGKFWRVDRAPAPDKIFADTNADVRVSCLHILFSVRVLQDLYLSKSTEF